MSKRKKLTAALTVCCAAALLLTACGGGGGDGGSADMTLVISSEESLDGFVTNTAFVDVNSEVSVGDTDGTFGNVSRGFVRFELLGIPAGATLIAAELRLFQFEVIGTPYATHGNLLADHVNLGATLDATDFAAVPIRAGVATISGDATLEYKSTPVTECVAVDIAAGRTTSDFRLRFVLDSDADAMDDYISFNDGMSPPDVAPMLVVTYRVP
jgi:hypothetical protein